MKPVTFLRNTWRKKDNKSKSKSQSVPLIRPLPSEAEPVAFSPKHTFGEAASVLSFEFDPTFQDSRSNMTDPVLVNESENWDLAHAQVIPRLRGKHCSLFHSSHGPPHNHSHGPPSLNIGRQSLRGGTPPPRPPRPPSLRLNSQPPPPTPRSPSRVKFAPDLHVRASQSTSSIRSAVRHISEASQSSLSQESVEAESLKDSGGGRNSYLHCSSSRVSTLVPYSESLPRTAEIVLDLPDALNSCRLHHASSSTPHLPRPQQTSRRTSTEPRGSLGSCQDTIASFPHPTPLRVRKRPQPLVLQPTPSLGRLPPSPLVSSAESTPLATPTTLSNMPSPKSSRITGRPLHTVSPPTFSPPDSPLPTPPVSQEPLTPSDLGKYNGRFPRTAKSASELQDRRLENFHTSHRATSSAPFTDLFAENEASRTRSPPRPNSYDIDSQSPEPNETSIHRHDPPIHWGYAL
ncbi:hypothetical protein LshimejAT787_0105740 [Lyophyllum shimeji]|uniref:Uncharacterized protein n=1 Tax=Lyophyllum shimeji TaxID=47721 RepID=A0A9P3PCZ3_LYOSH|nr:hypothetical protein LshimejAT787_0105740 [Lyophyllum shimeji]